MTISADQGPLIEWGQNPPQTAGAPPSDYNADYGPSAFSMGMGLLDPRYGYQIGSAGNGSAAAFFFSPGVNYVTVSQVPSTAAVNNIAAAANPASGTALTLVSATGAGITKMTVPLFIKPTGNTVPAILAIDGLPGFTVYGQNKALQGWDPNTTIARAVSVTGVASGSGGAITVRGYDLYGQAMTETITLGAGANTVNGKKAFKFVASATPAFTDTHAISVGTADVYGLPLKALTYGYINSTFNNAPVTAPGFVAADTTATATATTGDVRGTITSTSDGAKRLQIMQGVSPADLVSLAPGVYTGYFGVQNFAG